MGFESSQVARRRLAALAGTNEQGQDALVQETLFPGFAPGVMPSPTMGAEMMTNSAPPAGLVQQLEGLAHDILGTPGAGGALLASYAAQTRALRLVLEAARRAGSAPLPASVIAAAQDALASGTPLPGLALS